MSAQLNRAGLHIGAVRKGHSPQQRCFAPDQDEDHISPQAYSKVSVLEGLLQGCIGHGRTNVNNTDTRGDRVALHVAVIQIDENCAKTSIPVPSGIPLARLGQTEATQTVGPTHAQPPLRARVAFRRRDPYAFLLPCSDSITARGHEGCSSATRANG